MSTTAQERRALVAEWLHEQTLERVGLRLITARRFNALVRNAFELGVDAGAGRPPGPPSRPRKDRRHLRAV
jgi:hypothetical protein